MANNTETASKVQDRSTVPEQSFYLKSGGEALHRIGPETDPRSSEQQVLQLELQEEIP